LATAVAAPAPRPGHHVEPADRQRAGQKRNAELRKPAPQRADDHHLAEDVERHQRDDHQEKRDQVVEPAVLAPLQEDPEIADDEGRDHRVGARPDHRVADIERADQHDDRDEEIGLLRHRAELRQLLARQALHALLQRLLVDHEIDRQEVEQRRNDRGDDDLAVLDAGDLGHDEGAGAHDRRQDLPARRRRRLDRSRRSAACSPPSSSAGWSASRWRPRCPPRCR
jgi:hypothetical protein